MTEQDTGSQLWWYRLRAVGTTILAIANVAAVFYKGREGWFAALWCLYALSCWPCVLIRGLREYHRIPRAERRGHPKPLAGWIELGASLLLLATFVAAGFALFVFKRQ